MKKSLALFDFDGTVTAKDSLMEFLRFSVGNVRFFLGMAALSPILLGYKTKRIPNDRAKEKVLSYFFKGWPQETFVSTATEYSLDHLPEIVRPGALDRIAWHRDRGDDVVVVSASLRCWLAPWCRRHGVDLIATELEMSEGVVTGKFATKNCYGAEKVNRLEARYDLDRYEEIFAYGDSEGDKELLALADKSFYRPFR